MASKKIQITVAEDIAERWAATAEASGVALSTWITAQVAQAQAPAELERILRALHLISLDTKSTYLLAMEWDAYMRSRCEEAGIIPKDPS
jgi:hypothetical protein